MAQADGGIAVMNQFVAFTAAQHAPALIFGAASAPHIGSGILHGADQQTRTPAALRAGRGGILAWLDG